MRVRLGVWEWQAGADSDGSLKDNTVSALLKGRFRILLRTSGSKRSVDSVGIVSGTKQLRSALVPAYEPERSNSTVSP